MKTISILTEYDLAKAYQIELLSHPIPWSKQIFYSNQGDRYLNKKILLNDDVVGFFICQIIADEATLFNIAIHPNYQRKGLASSLLIDLMNELSHRQVHTLWLEVRASNQKAIVLYEKLGFNQITVRKNYYPSKAGKEDAIVMASTLFY